MRGEPWAIGVDVEVVVVVLSPPGRELARL